MPISIDVARVVRMLSTYDAIRRDVGVMASPVLESRLLDCASELLRVTGAGSIDTVRQLIDEAEPSAVVETHPKGEVRSKVVSRKTSKATAKRRQDLLVRQPKLKNKCEKKIENSYYRGQDLGRSASKADRRALSLRITSVVSGGLPGSSRRH
jgi:hypothetical protein